MATSFDFTALPTEVQMRIISFTNLVTDSPARDLCVFDKEDTDYCTAQYELPMCCGCCEISVTMQSVCPCWPTHRFVGASCECLIFAQPLLAVNRHVRTLALDHIYKHATFELGPNAESYHRSVLKIRKLNSAKTARVKRLQFLIDVQDEEEAALRSRSVWTELFQVMRSKFTRHDVRMKLLITPASFEVGQIVRQMRRSRDKLYNTNLDIEMRSESWYDDRRTGMVVE